MDKLTLEKRVEALDAKMDILLDYVNQQRLRNQLYEDLIADVSKVGKDLYDTAVTELDRQSVEIDPAALAILVSKLLKNLPNFGQAIDLFQSTFDLAKDAGPIVNEMIIDFSKKLHSLEEKGYFEFIRETGAIVDNVVTHFSGEDVRLLADNIVSIMETLKTITQPEMIHAISNAVQIFNSVEQEDIPSYSLFGALREFNKPEMKKTIGFIIVFLKNISKTTVNQNTKTN